VKLVRLSDDRRAKVDVPAAELIPEEMTLRDLAAPSIGLGSGSPKQLGG
jgi:hypothetical protein